MLFRKIRRMIFGVLMAVTVCLATVFSGCVVETRHPRVNITVEFNDETYVLEYMLYRNMYPQTVRHFIELAESGFYDDTIIHNYTSNDWYGGGYIYNEDAGEGLSYDAAYDAGAMDEYLNDADNYLEDDYIELFESGRLTASVYTDYSDYDSNGEIILDDEYAYYTLYGEFEANGHYVENGQRSAELGSLKMYYTDKVENNTLQLFAKTGKNGEVVTRNYGYNSATSLFAIQVEDSSSLSTSNYCTFAYLRNDNAVEVLEELIEAIEDYIEEEHGDDTDEFEIEVSGVGVDNIDTLTEVQYVTYTLPEVPIIIRSVKVVKY